VISSSMTGAASRPSLLEEACLGLAATAASLTHCSGARLGEA